MNSMPCPSSSSPRRPLFVVAESGDERRRGVAETDGKNAFLEIGEPCVSSKATKAIASVGDKKRKRRRRVGVLLLVVIVDCDAKGVM